MVFAFLQAMYSKRELNADSNYVVWTQFIRQAVKSRPEVAWVIVFPDQHSGYAYEDDGFFRLPNVLRVPQRVPVRRTANAVNFPAAWYENLFRDWGFDFVWSHLPEVSGQVRAAGRTTREPISKPFIVTQHNYVVHKSLPYEFHTHLALLELLGSMCSDVNVFNSDHCRAMHHDNARRFLSPEAIADIDSRSEMVPYGTLFDGDGLEPPKRWHDGPPVIAYNHRLLGHKNYPITFEVLAELHSEGVPFRVKFLNNTSERAGAIRKYPFVDVVLSPNRETYLAELRKCDLNVIHSQHETFCIAGVESMALGQPFIAPDGVTFPEITNRDENGYPYLFKTRAESKAHIKKLLTDTRERRKWGRILSDHVRSEYHAALWVERYFAIFDRAIGAHEVKIKDSARDKVREGLEVNHGKDLTDLYRWLSGKQGHVDGAHFFGTQTTTMTKLVRLIRDVGGEVRLVGQRPRVFSEVQ